MFVWLTCWIAQVAISAPASDWPGSRCSGKERSRTQLICFAETPIPALLCWFFLALFKWIGCKNTGRFYRARKTTVGLTVSHTDMDLLLPLMRQQSWPTFCETNQCEWFSSYLRAQNINPISRQVRNILRLKVYRKYLQPHELVSQMSTPT